MSKTTHESIGQLMLSFRRKINASAKKGTFERELTFSQIETLMLIAAEGRMTMERIANHFDIKPPTATALISKLEKKKHVLRKKDEKDRRVIYIELSSQTKKRIEEMWRQKEATLEKITSKLSKKDKADFIRILHTLSTD